MSSIFTDKGHRILFDKLPRYKITINFHRQVKLRSKVSKLFVIYKHFRFVSSHFAPLHPKVTSITYVCGFLLWQLLHFLSQAITALPTIQRTTLKRIVPKIDSNYYLLFARECATITPLGNAVNYSAKIKPLTTSQAFIITII